MALELKVAPDVIRAGLASSPAWTGGLQIRGQERGITVVDDYGHHPTEIRATLAAARLVRLPAYPCHLSAAPLHAHVSPDGRLRALVHTGRPVLRAGYLRRFGEAHRGRHRGGAGGAHPPVRPPRRRSMRARSSAAWKRCWRRWSPATRADAGRRQRLAGGRIRYWQTGWDGWRSGNA